MKKQKELKQSFVNLLLILIVTALILLTAWIVYQFHLADSISEKYLQNQIYDKKLQTKDEVYCLFNFIDRKRDSFLFDKKNELQEKVQQIKALISLNGVANYKQTINNLVDDNEYLWILDSTRKFQFSTQDSWQQNVRTILQTATDRFFIAPIAAAGPRMIFFIDRLADTNGYMVWAESYDLYLSEVKEQILDEVEARRFQTNGYFYIFKSSNLRLLMHPYSDEEGEILAQQQNYTGEKINVGILEAAKVNENGGFYNYARKFSSQEPVLKQLVYARIYEDWNWLVASNIDLIQIEKAALQKQDEMQNIINTNIAALTLVLLMFIIIIFLYFQSISKQLKRGAIFFTDKLRQALRKNEAMPTQKMLFKEIGELAESVNLILAEQSRWYEELEESRQFFRLLTQKIRTAIYTFGMDGKFIYANPAMERITGYSKQELNEMKFWEIVHPDSRELVKKRGTNRLQGKNEISTYNFKILRKDGVSRWIEIANSKTTLAGKQIVLGTGTDITERKEALQNLTESEKKYRTLIETMEEGVLMVDAQENFTFSNSAAAEIFETTTKMMLESNFRDFTSEETFQKLINYSGRRSQGKIDKYEFEIVTAKNNYKILQTKATPLIQNGKYLGSFGVMIDITERYSYENKLKQKNRELQKLKDNLQQEVKAAVAEVREKDHLLIKQSRQAALGEMLSNIAHQWRQPLTAVGAIIQNFDDAYEENILDADYLEEHVDKAMEIITQLSQTIDHFRSFFKPNKMKNKFNVAQQLQKILKFTKKTMRESDIEIVTNSEQDCFVYGYDNEYSQVIMNILLNAKDIFEERKIDKRKINIDVFKKGTQVVMEIADTAGGIDPKIMDKVFDPYFSTKHAGQGTGIGLYMGKMIIETNMDGSLNAANWEKGAKFIVSVKAYEQTMREKS